jgi:hypothetical protein
VHGAWWKFGCSDQREEPHLGRVVWALFRDCLLIAAIDPLCMSGRENGMRHSVGAVEVGILLLIGGFMCEGV